MLQNLLKELYLRELVLCNLIKQRVKFKNTNYYEWARKPNIFLQDRFDEFYEEMMRRTPQFLKEITRENNKENAEDRNQQQRL